MFATGKPLILLVPVSNGPTGIGAYARVVGDLRLPEGQQTYDRWFNNEKDPAKNAAVLAPEAFTMGNGRRTYPEVRGPKVKRLDLMLSRLQKVGRTTAELRIEAQNAFNTPQLADPVGDYNSVNYGRIITGGGERRLQLARGCPLQRRQRFHCLGILELPERDDGIHLKRPGQPGNFHQLWHRIRRPVIAQRLDHAAAKKILAAIDLDLQRFTYARVLRMRRQRANERRPHELAFFALERLEQRRDHRLIGMVLEIHVRDRPEPVVRIARNFTNQLRSAGIGERGQQHERFEPDVLVFVALDRADQRRSHRPGRCTPQGSRRVEPGREIEVAQRIDCRLHAFRRRRLWSALLRGCHSALAESGRRECGGDEGSRGETAKS
jgi:hypothetical protein